jgi:hypothetical protein
VQNLGQTRGEGQDQVRYREPKGEEGVPWPGQEEKDSKRQK